MTSQNIDNFGWPASLLTLSIVYHFVILSSVIRFSDINKSKTDPVHRRNIEMVEIPSLITPGVKDSNELFVNSILGARQVLDTTSWLQRRTGLNSDRSLNYISYQDINTVHHSLTFLTSLFQSCYNFPLFFFYIGCVRLASMGLPRGAHSDEPLTRANRTITLAISWLRHARRVTPKWPTPRAGHLGLTRVSHWNDVKAIRTYRGRPGSTQGS